MSFKAMRLHRVQEESPQMRSLSQLMMQVPGWTCLQGGRASSMHRYRQSLCSTAVSSSKTSKRSMRGSRCCESLVKAIWSFSSWMNASTPSLNRFMDAPPSISALVCDFDGQRRRAARSRAVGSLRRRACLMNLRAQPVPLEELREFLHALLGHGRRFEDRLVPLEPLVLRNT